MDILAAFSIMISMSLSFSLLTARYVRKRERALAVNTIDTLISSLQQALPDVVITQKTIPLNSHPYDHESEEAFEDIVKRFNK
jgi:hypothetical protein